MTSPRKSQDDLRSRSHGTPGCLPVPDPAVAIHAVVPGSTAKAGNPTSPWDIGEAHFTGASRETEE